MGLKHAYKSLKADPADATIIGASKWNADHFYVDAAGAPIGNLGALLYSGAAGAITHINSVAAGQVLASAGAGVAPAWTASPTLTSIILGGVTLDGTEFGYLDGVTPGVVTESKAVVVDANKDLGTFRNVSMKIMFAEVFGLVITALNPPTGFYRNAGAVGLTIDNVLAAYWTTAGQMVLPAAGGGLSMAGTLAIGNAVSAAAAVPSTHKVAITIGGASYFLLASNV